MKKIYSRAQAANMVYEVLWENHLHKDAKAFQTLYNGVMYRTSEQAYQFLKDHGQLSGGYTVRLDGDSITTLGVCELEHNDGLAIYSNYVPELDPDQQMKDALWEVKGLSGNWWAEEDRCHGYFSSLASWEKAKNSIPYRLKGCEAVLVNVPSILLNS